MNFREIVLRRCDGYCEKCGIPLSADFALHHRKLKSRGGKNDVTNLVALHHNCHNMGTESVHMKPEEATRRGLMVSSWDDPASVPVTLDDGSSVLLTEDGQYVRVDGRTDNGW
jgi:hypothetical protein